VVLRWRWRRCPARERYFDRIELFAYLLTSLLDRAIS